MRITEADVEQVALDWLKDLGWKTVHGHDIAPDTPGAERGDYGRVVLERRVRDALVGLNTDLPNEALEGAFRQLTSRGDRRWKPAAVVFTECWRRL